MLSWSSSSVADSSDSRAWELKAELESQVADRPNQAVDPTSRPNELVVNEPAVKR